MDGAYSPGRNELGEVRDEIRSVPQVRVLPELGIVGSVIQDFASRAVAGELLRRRGSPGDILSASLSCRVVAAVQAYGVVQRKPGVPPAREGL